MQVVTIDLSDLDITKKKLGGGRYGNVYEGNWKKDGGKKVAVKVILGASEMILPEIQVWSSLPSHQNIIAFFGVASASFNTFIVCELAVNGSLFDFLHIDMKKTCTKQSLAWALDIARGMKHLHDRRIIHRDLKSPNVLLTSGWVAKLCDFGTARELTRTVATTAQAGTYRWMSPEIMEKAVAQVNEKCDLFSYGMILFELFAHKIPYSDLENEVDVLKSVTSGERPPIPSTLPPYLHELLKCCWQKDTHLRPTFDDFVNKIVLT